jgi:hypothetical protein
LLKATGLDEDGWAAKVASLQLTQPLDADELTLRGMVPQIAGAGDGAFQSELVVLVDGNEAGRKSVSPGPLEMHLPVPEGTPDGPRPRHVELRFSATQPLPPPDRRDVGARFDFIGFKSIGDAD